MLSVPASLLASSPLLGQNIPFWMRSLSLPSWLGSVLPDWMEPLVWVLLGALLSMGALILVYYLMSLVFPKTAAIARTSARFGWSQPLFWVELACGAIILLLFVYIPYNTFGEDIKVVKDTGLTWIMVLAIVLAVWTASVSIADELEGKTALTLLSKPIGRHHFVLGKFLGILAPVFTMFLILGVLFLAAVSYKVVFDAKENSRPAPTPAQCASEIGEIVPGLALAFFEAVIMASISVAISTRLQMVPNLLICASVYVLGHLVPLLVNSSAGKVAIVEFVGRLLATVFPVLESFNMQAAVSSGRPVPEPYVAGAFAYCALYSTMAMLLALFLFEDRDLA